MQSYDGENKLVRSITMEERGNFSGRVESLDKELADPNVKHVIVGKLPYKGEEVRVNGLRYRVVKRDRKNRQLILELL